MASFVAGDQIECFVNQIILHKTPILNNVGNPVLSNDGKPMFKSGFKIAGGIDQDNTKSPQGYPDKGIYVTHVYEGSPADLAGLKKNDKILQVNGHDMTMVIHKKAVDYINRRPVLEMFIHRPSDDINNKNFKNINLVNQKQSSPNSTPPSNLGKSINQLPNYMSHLNMNGNASRQANNQNNNFDLQKHVHQQQHIHQQQQQQQQHGYINKNINNINSNQPNVRISQKQMDSTNNFNLPSQQFPQKLISQPRNMDPQQINGQQNEPRQNQYKQIDQQQFPVSRQAVDQQKFQFNQQQYQRPHQQPQQQHNNNYSILGQSNQMPNAYNNNQNEVNQLSSKPSLQQYNQFRQMN